MASKRQRAGQDKGGQGAAVSRLAGLSGGDGQRSGADWGAAMPELVASLVVAVTRIGGLASFGRTSDGGAVTITIFLDGERTTLYVKPSQNLDEELEKAIIYMDALG